MKLTPIGSTVSPSHPITSHKENYQSVCHATAWPILAIPLLSAFSRKGPNYQRKIFINWVYSSDPHCRYCFFHFHFISLTKSIKGRKLATVHCILLNSIALTIVSLRSGLSREQTGPWRWSHLHLTTWSGQSQFQDCCVLHVRRAKNLLWLLA